LLHSSARGEANGRFFNVSLLKQNKGRIPPRVLNPAE
jgi:hypothetical protein